MDITYALAQERKMLMECNEILMAEHRDLQTVWSFLDN